jgi:hypothetical protein
MRIAKERRLIMSVTKKVNGTTYECLILPMKNFQISQGCNGQYSHQGVNALDICGKDTGIEETIAPCKMKFITNDSYTNGNAVWFQSVNKVLFADGTVNYATMMFLHDNDISDIKAAAASGHVWAQGESFGDEGTAGYATGNHCHFEIAKGTFTSMYAKNSQGVWHLPNSISPDSACVTDGAKLYNSGQPTASGNKMSWKTSSQIAGTSTSSTTSTTTSTSTSSSSATNLDVAILNKKPTQFVSEKATFTVTVDSIKIRKAPSLKGTDTGMVYAKGMSVNYDGYVKNGGYVWISWIGSTGERRWMAAGQLNSAGANTNPYGTFK